MSSGNKLLPEPMLTQMNVAILGHNGLRGGMAPSGVIFHENVNFLFLAQKCQVIHAFHKIHKQNIIGVIETHTLGNFINHMVFGDQRVSTKKQRWWAAFSSIFLAATKQLYEWYFLSVCPSVRLSHLFDYVPIIVSSWNFQELSHWTRVRSMQKVKVRGQGHRGHDPNFRFRTVTPVWIHIWW